MRNIPSNLAELVSPLGEHEFLEILRARRLTLSRGAGDNPLGAVLGWNALIDMLERGHHPRGWSDIRLVKESKNIYSDRWLVYNEQEKRNRIDLTKVDEYMAQGYNLVITPIQAFIPELDALCDSVRVQLQEQTKIGVVVTTGTEGAFKVHYDSEDLAIMQVEGTKRWFLYGPPVIDPINAMPDPKPPPQENLLLDVVLEPGDLLFVPSGNWHHCENQSARSIHMGLFFTPPTPWHAVNSVVRQSVFTEKFRKPLTRLDSASQLEALEAEIKREIIAKIEALKMTDFLSQWSRKRSQ